MQGLDGIFNSPVNLFLVRPSESSSLYKKISAVASACFYLLSYRSMTTARFTTTVLSAVGINMLLRLLFESRSLEGGGSTSRNTDQGSIRFGYRSPIPTSTPGGLHDRLAPNTDRDEGVDNLRRERRSLYLQAQERVRNRIFHRVVRRMSDPQCMDRNDSVVGERGQRVLVGHQRERKEGEVVVGHQRGLVGHQRGLVGHQGGRRRASLGDLLASVPEDTHRMDGRDRL